MAQTHAEIFADSYIPRFNGQEPFIPIRDNPMIVIHPGFKYYDKDEDDQRRMSKFKGYDEYIERLKETLKRADSEGRTIIVYSPKDHVNDTLRIVGPLKNLVVIPSGEKNPHIDSETLGISGEKFYKILSKKITQAELAGEFNNGCVLSFEYEAGPFIELDRNHEIIFPSDEQLNIWGCRSHIEDLLTIPNKDFLVFKRKGDKFEDELLKAQVRLRKRLKEEHGVREGTCLSALITYFSKHCGIDNDYSRFPYRFYEDGMNWSRDTVRKNIKRMEGLGLVSVGDLNERDKKISQILAKAARESNIKFHTPRKMVESKVAVKSSDIDCEEEEMGQASITYIIRDFSAQGLEEAKEFGLNFDKVIDIRGMNESERAKVISGLYQEFKRGLKTRVTQDFRERGARLINEVTEKLNSLPHIKERYLIGSYAEERENETSDVDILLVRESCPGMKDCFYRFEKRPMDVFCFTGEEMKELERRKALVTANIKSLK